MKLGWSVVIVATVALFVAGCSAKDPIAPDQGGGPVLTLIVSDLRVGTGEVAGGGDQLTIHYRGYLQNGVKFDDSYERGQPFQFTLGLGRVIPGLDQGLVGMRVGGLRKLTIPPRLAYGTAGYPGVIPPNATVIFTVELLAVAHPIQ